MITAYPIQRAVLGGRAGIQTALLSGSAPDPINFSWIVRLQSHYPGNNTPLGLWQDSAMTTQATQQDDPIGAWSDELSDSGLVAVQPDPDKRLLLDFINGVPTVYCPGVDNFLEITSVTLGSPISIFLGVAYEDLLLNAKGIYGNRTGALFQIYQRLAEIGLTETGVADNNTSGANFTEGVFKTVTAVQVNGGASSIRVNGTQRASWTGIPISAASTIFIGKDGSGGFFKGNLTAAMQIPTLSDANRDIVETYIANLNP